jgi:uncharacterized membrane protein YvbJ
MRCSKCGMENPVGKKFCSQCGNGLSGRCPKCGAENLLSSRFCGDCGATLADNVSPAAAQTPNAAATAAQIRVTPEQPDASAAVDERKTVTALFADIKVRPS